jgi:hypothetical protein
MSHELADILTFNLYLSVIALPVLGVVVRFLSPRWNAIEAFIFLYAALVLIALVAILVEVPLFEHSRYNLNSITLEFGLVGLMSLPAFSGTFILLVAVSYLRDVKFRLIVLAAFMASMLAVANYHERHYYDDPGTTQLLSEIDDLASTASVRILDTAVMQDERGRDAGLRVHYQMDVPSFLSSQADAQNCDVFTREWMEVPSREIGFAHHRLSLKGKGKYDEIAVLVFGWGYSTLKVDQRWRDGLALTQREDNPLKNAYLYISLFVECLPPAHVPKRWGAISQFLGVFAFPLDAGQDQFYVVKKLQHIFPTRNNNR